MAATAMILLGTLRLAHWRRGRSCMPVVSLAKNADSLMALGSLFKASAAVLV
jgi:hypothetical protein